MAATAEVAAMGGSGCCCMLGLLSAAGAASRCCCSGIAVAGPVTVVSEVVVVSPSACGGGAVGTAAAVTEEVAAVCCCTVGSSNHEHAADYYKTLRARGYPPEFLHSVYSSAPSWLTRDQLLQRRSASDDTDTRLQPFVVSYTRDLEATHINRSIHSASVVLPPHLQLGRRLVSWRAASRLSSMLITYRFPRDA